MTYREQSDSIETLEQIRQMMERSTRFLSLSGWSGVWAGMVALSGAAVAHSKLVRYSGTGFPDMRSSSIVFQTQLLALAGVTFMLALAGAIYFTVRKNKRSGSKGWNQASRRMLLNLGIPIAVGGVFVLAFVARGDWYYAAPASLIFYGLALVNSSKYTVSDIRYLGMTEVILGCISLALHPTYSLYLWATGFGLLHIIYGILMWRKYDRS